MKRLLVCIAVALLPTAGALHAQEAEVEYDKFTKRTSISSGGFIDGEFKFFTGFECPGDQLCEPESVHGSLLRSSSNGWQYLRFHPVVFLLDGEESIEIGPTDHRGDVISGRTVMETIRFMIPWHDFVKMANASTVEYRVGITDARLNAKQHAAIKAIVALVVGQ